ncbi:MAG: DUF4038 domain-containing protein [Chloroflexota bacterium]|nr:DUF4038 domain-containing protein [Chloroflexota bacterium]
MTSLEISKSRDIFIRNARPFFYLADTVWSAFTNASRQEWDHYLTYRQRQGFNVLQINVLAQWDRSESDLQRHPFNLNSDGTYDFHQLNDAYFDRAEQMLAMAVDRGFIPALVLLWSNYVPGTFFDNLAYRDVMPKEQIAPYVEYVAKRFARFNPIFFVSGDTNFEKDIAAEHYYAALETVKRITPQALTSLHLCGGLIDAPAPDPVEIPRLLLESPHLDFYQYQSSHFYDHGPRCYTYAQSFYHQPIKRPIINGEPCYEGLEFNDHRHGPAEIRQATWFSLLSGAKAGIAYGAQGIWQWHRKGNAYPPAMDDDRPLLYRCEEPFDWRTALRFDGAWECGFARWLFETYDLFDIEPRQEILNPTANIRMSATGDHSKVVIYSPYATEIQLAVDLSRLDWRMIVLGDKQIARPEVVARQQGSAIKMPPFNSDMLFIGNS